MAAAALTVVVVLTLLGVAVAVVDQGAVLADCIKNSALSKERGDKLSNTIFDLDDIPNMEEDVKGVYYCLLHNMTLADDNYCIMWEKVCDWYSEQLPPSVREKYMAKHKPDIMACDTGCKPEEKSKNINGMLIATKCVFDFMRQAKVHIEKLQ